MSPEKGKQEMNEQIIEILKEIRPEFEFDGVDNFFDEGMLDSFDLMSLVSSLGSQFGVQIKGEDILPENFANVDAIVCLLEKLNKSRSLQNAESLVYQV